MSVTFWCAVSRNSANLSRELEGECEGPDSNSQHRAVEQIYYRRNYQYHSGLRNQAKLFHILALTMPLSPEPSFEMIIQRGNYRCTQIRPLAQPSTPSDKSWST